MLRIIYGVIFKRKLIVDGLNSGKVIENIMNEACNQKKIYNINEMIKDLLIPAVDASSGKVYRFNSCRLNNENAEEKYIPNISIGKAVRASCSYPVLFSPCKYEDKKLLDGEISGMKVCKNDEITYWNGVFSKYDFKKLRCLIDVETGEYIYYPKN